MLRIGLTGGIGSGKTTVAKIFSVLGIPVYYADDAAKQLMNKDKTIKAAIIREFGEKSYENEELNRPYIASVVFSDPVKLAWLNALTHPATIKHAAEWMEQQTTPYIIKEAALIFESGSDKMLDYVIGVHSPKTVRINRVMERDHVTSEEVIQRMARQMDEEEKMKRCDFIINNTEHDLIVPQVIALHERFLGMLDT